MTMFALACLLALPSVARAQSAFAGVVRDTTGAVLPGVTVEASSPALIEQTRSATTDSNGAYKIDNIRPGVYVLTFTLPGFASIKREGLELQSDFTMTINAELKVGAVEETVTVSGASPIVDVQSTTKSQVLNRDTLDAIPTGRTIQGMGQLITGVSLNQPDVGGSKAMQQTYMSAHGAGASQTTVQVDGLLVNGIDVDGAVQSYFNSSMSQEMVYTTSGASADVAGGGVRLNMIPRDGGNTPSGSIFLGYQRQSFQANNVTQDLRNRGLTTSDGIGKLFNAEGAFGGPIKKDTLWFFGSARNFILDTLPANTFNGIPGTGTATSAPLPDKSSPGVDPQSIRSFQARFTWQISPKNKLAFYTDRLLKNRGSAMTAGYDPATAGIVWTSPIYMTGSLKYSSTLSNRLFLESGFSTNYERYNTLYQPGLAKDPFTPDWYTVINRNDLALGTQWGAGATNQGMYPDRFAAMASTSYVTGTHNVKFGIQDTWGRYRQFRSANGDLRANFFNGVAQSVDILNTPVNFQDNLKADLGIYGQDSWTVNRLTINYGARWEYFASGIPEETSGVGRFVPQVRTFGPIDMPTWTSFAPRGGVVYDLFGNQKTALKFSIGRYEQAGTTGFSNRFNPLALLTQRVSWTDLNHDGVPEGTLGCVYLTPGCEINFAQLPKNFGVANLPTFDPNIKRMYNLETSVSVQHELMTGVSVTGGWYNRQYKNMWRRTNTGVGFSDFTPFTVFSPIDGTPITYYNISAAKVSQIGTNLVDTNAPDRTDKYNGFEYNFTMRLPRHITLFGGGMSERMLSNSCDDNWNPNLLLYCNQSQSGLPFRTQFKIAGSIPFDYGIVVSVAFQSLPGYLYGTSSVGALTGVSGPSGAPSATQLANPNGQGTVWLITNSTRYTSCPGNSAAMGCVVGALVNPGQTQATLSIPLVAPMTEYGDRINQLDLNVVKSFKWNRVTFQPKLDIFNVLNRAPVTAVLGLNYGTSAYYQPSVVLNPRTFQIGGNIRF